MSEEQETPETPENSNTDTAQEEKKSPAAETPKPEPPPIRHQKVYRLLNGEWEDFETADQPVLDKTFLVYERTLTLDGEIITEVELDPEGNEVQKTINTFNEAGKPVKNELYNEGFLAETVLLEYDDKGRLVKEQHEFEEGFPITTSYTYDSEGRITEKRNDDSEGEMQKRETFAYHERWKDKIVRHEVYDEEDELSLEELSEWEEREGEPHTKQFIHHDHTLGTYRRSVFFDPRQREDNIAYVSYNDRDKTTDLMRVIHDEKGREIEEHSESVNDSENFQVYYTYDDLDRIIAQEQRQQDKIMTKINRRFGEDGHVLLVAIRSITRGMYVDWFVNEYHEGEKK